MGDTFTKPVAANMSPSRRESSPLRRLFRWVEVRTLIAYIGENIHMPIISMVLCHTLVNAYGSLIDNTHHPADDQYYSRRGQVKCTQIAEEELTDELDSEEN